MQFNSLVIRYRARAISAAWISSGRLVAAGSEIHYLAAKLPRSGRSAIAFVALISIAASLFSWALSLIFGSLLARELARRSDLHMDYRAAGAAAFIQFLVHLPLVIFMLWILAATLNYHPPVMP